MENELECELRLWRTDLDHDDPNAFFFCMFCPNGLEALREATHQYTNDIGFEWTKAECWWRDTRQWVVLID
jgi:hypothetical protein